MGPEFGVCSIRWWQRSMTVEGLYQPIAAAVAAASDTIVIAITVVCVLCLIVHSAD